MWGISAVFPAVRLKDCGMGAGEPGEEIPPPIGGLPHLEGVVILSMRNIVDQD
jgi:hypothetical protein